MKAPFLVLLLLFYFNNSFSQFKLSVGNYNSFDGRVISCYVAESDYTVVFIDSLIIKKEQLEDTLTLKKMLKRIDTLYAFYKNNLGYQPAGGNPRFSNKCNVFFGAPSCGSGCGLIGAKGIEVDGFNSIFYNLKYSLNVNRDVIIGYEFGRNFFDFSSKILFPFAPNSGERNGGFAEAFAGIMYQFAFDEIIDDLSERQLNETLMNLKWSKTWYRGYINDTSANPYNSYARWDLDGVLDPNRGRAGHDFTAYFATTALYPIFDIFGKDRMFPGFFINLRQQPNVVTIEDALSNIALAASKTIQTNLNPFFQNVLKFRLNQSAIDEIAKFPKATSRLIKDEELLYFFSPFDTVNLNLRSTNYLADNCKYLIMDNTDTVSYSENGNNYFSYSLLRRRTDVNLKCFLINPQGAKIDSFSTVIRKRDRVRLVEKASDMFSYYLSNETVKSYFADSVLVIEGLEKNKTFLNRGLVYWSTVFRRDRILKLESTVKHQSPIYDTSYGVLDGLPATGWSNVYFGGPARINGTGKVGYDVGQGDTTSFYTLSMSDSSSLFIPPPSNRKYSLNNIAFQSSGFSSKGFFKDVVLSDITDTDNDGILDFEDLCPTLSVHTTPPSKYDTSVCVNSKSFSLGLKADPDHQLLWYKSNLDFSKPDTIAPTIAPTVSGDLVFYVSRLNKKNGCESEMIKQVVSVFPNPTKPLISKDQQGFLVASSQNAIWYKDEKLTGDTLKKIKPSSNGYYSAIAFENSCVSALSDPYFYVVTGINDLISEKNISVSPNPFEQEIKVNFSLGTLGQVFYTIVDISGKKIIENKKIMSGQSIELKSLSGGIYIIELRAKNGELLYRKQLVKNK